MKRVWIWLDRRTGCAEITKAALYENVPGGARWRYVWGSTLVFTFAVQVITGIFLWMSYSPSAHTAWESVFYIQNEMIGGWLLRGIHHFTAQAMNVLLMLHLMQVVIDGAYKAPRELNFWLGIGLLLLVLGLSLTGYLLPWDQKGYWATKVSTNLLGITPALGPLLQRVIVGGSNYGHPTLTRFFALHAGVLPGLIILLVIGHIYLFRKHGLTPKQPLRRPDEYFWPDQILKDAVACLAVMAAVLVLVYKPYLFGHPESLGADLGAPADPSRAYSAARPEWYFLFLFQFLKYFPGHAEVWGALFIPGLVLLIIFLMPLIGRWQFGHRFNVAFLLVLLISAGVLTALAVVQDRNDKNYQAAVRAAGQNAERIRVLALGPGGIPAGGALVLLRSDPLTEGPQLFAQHCAGCHRYQGHDGLGQVPSDLPAASDLQGFASRQWLTGLLNPASITNVHYFGQTKLKNGKMVKFVTTKVAHFIPEKKQALAKVIQAVSAEAQLENQQADDARDQAAIAQGREFLRSTIACTDCHEFHKPDEEATAPDLTGYGSKEWLRAFLFDPGQPRFYGSRNDRMPAFGKDKRLDAASIDLLIAWLRGEWYRPGQAN